ncbi:UPF0496 protein 4-like [Magnolia sinica]|uniref:UPF0496 protein 4-like n=1 Tax=Magnolia sinica TaxID=86752 RepID=UPI00265B63A7|nr:UPF0496 protein 4-like [Magnolia sinica]
MSRPHDGQRPFFPFGNPFRMILPKGSDLSPKLLALLNSFEQTLADRLKKLKPKDNSEVLSLSWMRLAMDSLCETHMAIKTLITELQFPISDWDEKWMDTYLDNSVKLLDICIAFSSEISRLNQGHLLLQYVLHILDSSSGFPSMEQLVRARSSLHDWMQQINSKNSKLENCTTVLHGLIRSLHLAKFKNSAKGKVLMRAMHGVKVQTVFICSVFTAAFSGSMEPLINLNISDKFLWSEAFNDLQVSVNREIRGLFSNGTVTVLKEVEAVHGGVQKLYSMTDFIRHEESENLKKSISSLQESMERLVQGLDSLSKQVESFFQTVLTGRDALLCNLRIADLPQENNGQEQVVT